MDMKNFLGTSNQNNTFYNEVEGDWNFVSDFKNNSISRKRADPETRKRQLKEYKAKEIARLEEQIIKVKNLY